MKQNHWLMSGWKSCHIEASGPRAIGAAVVIVGILAWPFGSLDPEVEPILKTLWKTFGDGGRD
jgi:hypothetical protein